MDKLNFKVKILQSLRAGPKTFTELQKELRTKSPTGVADALKQLEKKDFIKHIHKDQRRYHITQSGRLTLQSDQLLRQLSSGGTPGYLENYQSIPQDNLKVEKIKAVFEEQNGFNFPYEISVIGDSDINFQILVNKINLTLSYLPQVLTVDFAKEIGRQRGLRAPSSLAANLSLPEKFFSETLRWIKKAYNFEITLLLHFNPRQTVNSIEWTKAIKKANETDEKLARVIQERQDAYGNKEEALKTVVNKNLEAAVGEMTSFLKSAYNSPLNSGSNMAISDEALLDRITERILHDPFVEGCATKKEMRTILDAKLKEENIKMTSITIYGIEQCEKKDTS